MRATREGYAVDPDRAEAVRVAIDICARARAGDREARIPPLGDSAQAVAPRDVVNDLLDQVDTFVREAGATSAAAADGRLALADELKAAADAIAVLQAVTGRIREMGDLVDGRAHTGDDGLSQLAEVSRFVPTIRES